VTSPAAGAHRRWDELAAGYALHALEPGEEQEFTEHLRGCAECRRSLDDHSFVAAQLGALAGGEEDEAPSWAALRSGVVGAHAAEPAVVDLAARRRRRGARLLAAAAALVVLAGAATVGWALRPSSGHGGPRRPSAVAACAHESGCHLVHLQADGSERAVVVVRAGSAQMIPTALGAPTAGHSYALWQLPRDGRPVLVASMSHVTAGRPSTPVRLVLPYAETAAFGLSVEPDDTVPTTPTRVVAVGTAPA
jgi:anti-sigma-K factor RskA